MAGPVRERVEVNTTVPGGSGPARAPDRRRVGSSDGLDADEAVVAGGIGDAAAGAGEIGIERGLVLVHHVPVAAGGIALPDLDQRVGHGPSALVEHAALDDDALPLGLAGVLPGEVGFLRRHVGVAVDRAGDLRQRLRDEDQRLFGERVRVPT